MWKHYKTTGELYHKSSKTTMGCSLFGRSDPTVIQRLLCFVDNYWYLLLLAFGFWWWRKSSGDFGSSLGDSCGGPTLGSIVRPAIFTAPPSNPYCNRCGRYGGCNCSRFEYNTSGYPNMTGNGQNQPWWMRFKMDDEIKTVEKNKLRKRVFFCQISR